VKLDSDKSSVRLLATAALPTFSCTSN